MPADKRFNLRDWLLKFSDTSQANLRDVTNEVARRILQELPGGDPGDIEPPGQPTDLVAIGGVESVTLVWTPPSDLDVVRYRVQRSETSGSGFSTITETLDTMLIDNGLTGGTTYYYQVAAIDDSGNVGEYSEEAFATPTASGGSGTPPDPPGNITVFNRDAEVGLTWVHASPTAVSTTVLRSDDTGGPYTVIASGLTGLSYRDNSVTNGEDYFYVLRAVNGNGDVSANSVEVVGEPFTTVNEAPPTPTNFTASGKYLSVALNWSPVVAPDLDHYLLEYGKSSGIYTDELEIPVLGLTLPVLLSGLDPATFYYFQLSAVDTAGNVSDPTDEEAAKTIDDAAPPTPTAPATPTNFRVVSEGNRTVTFAWNPNLEADLANYMLAVYLGPGVPSQVGGPGWVSAAVIPAGVNSRVLTAPYLTNEQTFYFGLFARNTSGQLSEPTAAIPGTPTAQTGGGGGGGGGVGGGTGTTVGVINGDTGLGPLHRAPGATFDVVLDFSFYTVQTNLFLAIGAQLQNLQANNPAGFFNGKRVAVLLPSRNYRFQDNGLFGSPFESMSIGQSLWFAESMFYPYADDFQLHFIGPYPGGDLNADPIDAIQEPYDFKLSSTTDTELGWSRGTSTQGHGMIGFWPQAARNRLGLWFVQMNAGCWSSISGEAPLDVNKGGAAITLFGTRFVAPYHFNNFHSVTGAGPGTNADAYMPRFLVSTYRMKFDFVQYVYADVPYLSEHIFYERNPPTGDVYWNDCTFRRSGGNVLQASRRMQGSPQGDEGPDMTQGQFAGTHYLRRILVENCGRSWWSSSHFEIKNVHRLMDFDDSCVIVNNNPGCAASWPPPNLATLASDEFCDPPYSRHSSASDTSLPGFITNTGENGAPPILSDGHQNAGVKIRDTKVFIREPESHFISIMTSRFLDVEGSVFLANIGTRGVMLVFFGNPAAGVAQNAINSVSLSGNNTPALIAEFEGEHSDVVGPYTTLTVQHLAPPPHQFGGLRSGPLTVHGDMDDTISVTNIQ